MLLSKKEQAQNWIKQHQNIQFTCIHCGKPLFLDQASLLCLNQHRFDIARQGYLFLAKKPSDSQYDLELFKLRREIIMQSLFYAKLHSLIDSIIAENQPQSILDAGSGEGSHLNRCRKTSRDHVSLLGLDISKEAIQLSTDYNQDQFNLVADLAKLPFADGSFDMILSILSPSNYVEFKRVMTQNARIIKVIPNPAYLKEIRQAMTELGLLDTEGYSNKQVIEIFIKHFPNYEKILIQDQVPLSSYHRYCLAHMTPLTWNLSQEEIDLVIDKIPERVSLDLTVLIARKN